MTILLHVPAIGDSMPNNLRLRFVFAALGFAVLVVILTIASNHPVVAAASEKTGPSSTQVTVVNTPLPVSFTGCV